MAAVYTALADESLADMALLRSPKENFCAVASNRTVARLVIRLAESVELHHLVHYAVQRQASRLTDEHSPRQGPANFMAGCPISNGAGEFVQITHALHCDDEEEF